MSWATAWAYVGAGFFVFLAICVVCATVARVAELRAGYTPPVKDPKPKKNSDGPAAKKPAHRADEEESSSSSSEPTDEQLNDIVDAFIESSRNDAD